MKEDPTIVDTLFKRVTDFTLTYTELTKLKAINKLTQVASAIFPDLIISILMLVFLLFINLGLAFWFGDMLGKIYFGFLLIAAFYLVIGGITHFFMRGWIRKTVANYFIRQIFR